MTISFSAANIFESEDLLLVKRGTRSFSPCLNRLFSNQDFDTDTRVMRKDLSSTMEVLPEDKQRKAKKPDCFEAVTFSSFPGPTRCFFFYRSWTVDINSIF